MKNRYGNCFKTNIFGEAQVACFKLRVGEDNLKQCVGEVDEKLRQINCGGYWETKSSVCIPTPSQAYPESL